MMKDEKQIIEEMAKDLQETHDYEGCEAWHCGGCKYDKYSENYFCSSIKQAEKMTAKGYRKQIEGKWIYLPDNGNGWFQNGQRIFPKSCSVCGGVISYGPYKFCPNCGAKMKGDNTDA